MSNNTLKAPFPWFGGKSRAADLIWQRFGAVANYVEPFAGSAAVLLGKPARLPRATETLNDLDGFICNLWRAIQADPEAVARAADWPVSELDLHARHSWLVNERATLTEHLQADPTYYDATLAGWWVWGACSWIGSGWCSGKGPWQRIETADGLRLTNVNAGNSGTGVNRKLPHLGDGGTGVNRQLPHLGDGGKGGVLTDAPPALDWLRTLAERLRSARITCGDWRRVTGPSVTTKHGLTGMVLDPPYNSEDAENDCYGIAHTNVADDVRAWCLENGGNPLLRIALCGYAHDHDELLAHGWSVESWKARKGYQTDGDNSARERIWFSPACLSPMPSLFD